eukprot:6271206-Alexandrium_andersonii.AAC.1
MLGRVPSPVDWAILQAVPLPKIAQAAKLSGHRPIALEVRLAKVYMRVLLRFLQPFLTHQRQWTFGFRPSFLLSEL